MNYVLLLFAALFVSILALPIIIYGFTQPIGLALLVFGPWLLLVLSTIYEKLSKWLLKRRK